MKKIFSILLCGILILNLSSCKDNQNKALSSSPTTTSKALNITENSQITTSVPLNEESSSAEQSSSPSSEKAPPAQDTPPSTPKYATTVNVFDFTVNDPENLRGLSTAKNGFSFGVASNGKPHSQSVANQNKFDGYNGVKALALDVKTTEKIMYLTFDNGYEYENLTANILDTLKEKGVKAAFFITMSYAKSNKDLVQRMINEGHIVGNHSTTHPSFPSLTRSEMADEIAQLNNYLIQNFSYSSPYFRFPAGEYSESSLELVTSIGFKSVFWSAAYADWDTKAQKGADHAYNTVTSRFHPGAVILLHAVSKDNTEALGRIIDNAVNNGYTFKTLDNYFSE